MAGGDLGVNRKRLTEADEFRWRKNRNGLLEQKQIGGFMNGCTGGAKQKRVVMAKIPKT